MKASAAVWLLSGLLLVGALGTACRGDGDEPTGVGAGGEVSRAGSSGDAGKPSIGGTGGSGGAGLGGEAGGGAGQECRSGFVVVKQVSASTGDIVAWPAQHRFAVNHFNKIGIYEIASNGSVALANEVEPALFGPADSMFGSLAAYGSGFVATVNAAQAKAPSKLVRWNGDDDIEELLSEPGAYMMIGAAAEGVGVAVSAGLPTRQVFVAQREGSEWAWSTPFSSAGRRLAPLAFEAETLLVGVEELGRGEGGEGGGGAGGADASADAGHHARLEKWSLAGARLETHRLAGNARVALSTEHGWLIGETNSFWGSYQAAIELLDQSGTLHQLSDVRVISAGDGEDGAHDLALLNDRLLVANCESGLLSAPWSTNEVELTAVLGPWSDGDGNGVCQPSEIEIIDDVVALAGDGKLLFVRPCK